MLDAVSVVEGMRHMLELLELVALELLALELLLVLELLVLLLVAVVVVVVMIVVALEPVRHRDQPPVWVTTTTQRPLR